MRFIAWLVLIILPLGLVACDDDGLAGPPPPSGALRFGDLDVGYLHACALTREGGRAWCWGSNVTGALGNGTIEPSPVPVQVKGNRRYLDLDSGAGHNCALDDEGAAWCWGYNDEGQLGNGELLSYAEPVQVQGDHRFTSIASGHDHNCGVTADGEVWCWGDDSEGQIGNGQDDPWVNALVPARAEVGEPVVQVAAAHHLTCALGESGTTYCWGTNYVGQLGDETYVTRHLPVAVSGGLEFDTVAVGDGFACGLEGRDLWCWGSNRFHELARTPVDSATTPQPVEVGDVRQIAPAFGAETMGGARPYACALRGDRRAICWGGAISTVRSQSHEPTLLHDAMEFSRIASGPSFVCGLRVDGYAYCAGDGTGGQLGHGDFEVSSAVVPVSAPAGS